MSEQTRLTLCVCGILLLLLSINDHTPSTVHCRHVYSCACTLLHRQIKLRKALLQAIQHQFDKCVEDATGPVEQNCSHFILFGRSNFFSYPYDSPRNPLRHPDILELIDMLTDPTLSVRFDLKVSRPIDGRVQ